jgi:hypothetical protein
MTTPSDCLDFRVAGFQGFRVSGFQGFRRPEFRGFGLRAKGLRRFEVEVLRD